MTESTALLAKLWFSLEEFWKSSISVSDRFISFVREKRYFCSKTSYMFEPEAWTAQTTRINVNQWMLVDHAGVPWIQS